MTLKIGNLRIQSKQHCHCLFSSYLFRDEIFGVLSQLLGYSFELVPPLLLAIIKTLLENVGCQVVTDQN